MNFGVLASTGPTMRNLRTPRHAEATVDRFNGAGARVPGMIRLVRHSIALVAAGLAAALSGCDSHNSGSLGADPRQVTVFGSGQVQGVPDTLIADVGIQVTAADVTSAMNQTNDRRPTPRRGCWPSSSAPAVTPPGSARSATRLATTRSW